MDRDYGVFVPTGQRSLNPETALGSAILREAEIYGIDPHHLADAVDAVWQQEREATAEVADAQRAARRETGLNQRRIDQWEDAGKDHAEYPRLDEMARELAGSYPALGIGRGYDRETGHDDTDYAGRLWEVLRNRSEKLKPKHHPDIIRQAAELVASCATGEADSCRPMTFSTERWADYLSRKSIPWPRLESGALALDDDTFREMARAYPAEVAPIRELRHALSQLRLNELVVGSDGRNRLLLSAFGSKTSRNQPSNSRFIFGPSTWLRSLIRPDPGRAAAYVDWSAQEYGIAAALSCDPGMMRDYQSGDPYLTFAKRAGLVPLDATKQTHAAERDRVKVCCGLGAMYGASEASLAMRLGISSAHARELLQLHHQSYPTFWRWSDAVQDFAMLHGYLETVFGWKVHVGHDANPRSLRNFPMQANGAEMMRLACCLATEWGIAVCAPVHDALLIEGPTNEIDAIVARTQEAMQKASALVLDGFALRTDAKIVRYPGRYTDERGRRMWETVWQLLEDLDGNTTPCTDAGSPPAPLHPPSSLLSLL